MLAPSLFMGTSSSCVISCVMSDGKFALLHSHCLSGCEGGVVTALDEEENTLIPIALLTVPLRSAKSQRLDVSPAVSLQSIAEAIWSCGLPLAGLPLLLGPAAVFSVFEQLACKASSGHIDTRSLASKALPALPLSRCRWFCTLSYSRPGYRAA